MAIEVSKIQSPFNKSRKDKFLLVFNIPKGLREIDRKYERSNYTFKRDSFQFSLYSATIPKIQVPAVPTRYAGGTIHISSHSRPPFPPVPVSFNIDNRFENYWVIFQWLNVIRDQYDGRFGTTDVRQLLDYNTPLTEYSTSMHIYAVDEFDKPTVAWQFTHAFPVELGEIEYNYQDPDEISSSFQFVFSNMFVELQPTSDQNDII